MTLAERYLVDHGTVWQHNPCHRKSSTMVVSAVDNLLKRKTRRRLTGKKTGATSVASRDTGHMNVVLLEIHRRIRTKNSKETDLAVLKQSIRDGRLKLDCGTEIPVVMGAWQILGQCTARHWVHQCRCEGNLLHQGADDWQ